LLIGLDEFEFEGALKKHNFSMEQIKEMNYLHSVSVTKLKMSEIINNNKLTLFDEQREAIQKEKEEKLRNDKDVIEAIDAIFGKRNDEEDEEFDDLPF
jgi:DNA-binding transcriptional MerR regulator